jgi:hypothetical protein
MDGPDIFLGCLTDGSDTYLSRIGDVAGDRVK